MDESINEYEGWNALKLKQGNTINITLKREGGSSKFSSWTFGEDSTIEITG